MELSKEALLRNRVEYRVDTAGGRGEWCDVVRHRQRFEFCKLGILETFLHPLLRRQMLPVSVSSSPAGIYNYVHSSLSHRMLAPPPIPHCENVKRLSSSYRLCAKIIFTTLD